MFQRAKPRLHKSKRHPQQENREADNSHTRPKNRITPIKRRMLFGIAVLVAAVAIPYIFATAANSNEVAKAAAILVQPTQSATPTPSPTPTLPATSDGQLTADLTETTTWAEPPAPSAEPSPFAEPTPEPSVEAAYTSLKPGDDDPFVAIIQQRLMDLEYMEPDDPTTLFGPITSQAIQYFQRKNGLQEDGIAGVETQTLLFSASAKKYTVSEGATGPDVESIQDRLKELGYTVGNTGYFGSDTTKAVKYFQRMNGLTDDGNVGSDTRESLYSTKAEPSVEYTKSHTSGGSKSNGSSNGGGSSNSGSKSGGSSGGSASTPPPASNPGNAEAFVQAALSLLGKPYVWGGKGPNNFDCSGFVYYALKISGNGIGYMTSAGWHGSGYTKISKMSDLQRGDVIDYRGHVGIYLGDGKMVDASSSEGKIRISSNIFTSSYWTSHFLEGRRVF